MTVGLFLQSPIGPLRNRPRSVELIVDPRLQHHCQSGASTLVWKFPSVIQHLIVILFIRMKYSVFICVHNDAQVVWSVLAVG